MTDKPSLLITVLTAVLAAPLIAQQPPAPAPGSGPAPATAPAAPAPAPDAPKAPTETPKRGPITKINGGVALNFQDAPLDTVLSYLSEVAGLVIIRDAEIKGRVTVISRQALTVNEAVDVLNSVLKEKGYAGVRVGRTLKIVEFASAKKSNIPVHIGSDPEQIAETDEVITQVMPIKHVDAVKLKTDLAALISENADVSANQGSNTLIITDTSMNIRRLAKIINAMDTAVAGVSAIKVFPLQYANAQDAAKLINDIFRDNQRNRSGSSSGRDPRSEFFRSMFGSRGGSSSSQGGATSGGPRAEVETNASADVRTNTVVVSATPETIEIIGQMLSELDANPISQQGVFIYSVKNGDAKKMETVLQTLFGTQGGVRSNQQSSTSSTSKTTNRDRASRSGVPTSSAVTGAGGSAGSRPGGNNPAVGNPATPGFIPPGASVLPPGPSPEAIAAAVAAGIPVDVAESAADLIGQVYIVANVDTNSLVVMANPKLFDQVKRIIDQLDRPVQQVLIKVLIAEVTHDKTIDIGTEWSVLNVPGASTIGTNFGLAAAPGGLVYKLITDEVTATIKALETVGNLDVLSRPYILASDNQLATITVGDEVPFIRNSRVTDTGQTVNTIQYDDVGIILNVTPHINPDGIVVLDVAPEISAVDFSRSVPISDTVSSPLITKRSAKTRIAIKDGQTIVIGGLMGDQINKKEQKVPILGDIPLVGILFKRVTDEKKKTELLIFLTPHVAKLPEELKPMTEDEKSTLKLTPNAVEPGAFQTHMENMERGAVPRHPVPLPNSPMPDAKPVPPPTAPPAPAPNP